MTSTHSERLMEWMFSVIIMAYGLWLLAPGDTFNGAQYAIMRSIAPETVWGAVAVSVGVVRMVALYVNGSWQRTPIIRIMCSILGEGWWLAVGFLLLSGPEHTVPAGIVFYPVFAVFEALSAGRAARDAYYEKSFRFNYLKAPGGA